MRTFCYSLQLPQWIAYAIERIMLGGWNRSNFAATVLLPFCEYAKICKQCAVTMNNCNFVGQMNGVAGCSCTCCNSQIGMKCLAYLAVNIYLPLISISPFHAHPNSIGFICQKLQTSGHFARIASRFPLPSRPFLPFPEKRVKTNKHTRTARCKNLQPNLYWCLQCSSRDAWWAGNRYFIIFFRET